MRISLLLQREPFGRILEKTLKVFLDEKFKGTYRVKWSKTKSFDTESSDSQHWLCNYYLNAIFVPEVSRSTLNPVIQEFSRSIKSWRIPLQKLYVYLATTLLANRFAGAHIYIYPPISNPHGILIIGGNHHIRLLDYNQNCCFVIHKDGFDDTFLKYFMNSAIIFDLDDTLFSGV